MSKPKSAKAAKVPKFSKVIVVALLLFTVLFTVAMIAVFITCGAVPDSLVTAYFAFAGGEAGFLGLIKYGDTKFTTKHRDANADDDGACG